jgi:hypothetical protein
MLMENMAQLHISTSLPRSIALSARLGTVCRQEAMDYATVV